MKHLARIIVCLLSSGLAATAQVKPPQLANLPGASVDKAADLITVWDNSAGINKKLSIAEITNVPALFDNAHVNSVLASNPAASRNALNVPAIIHVKDYGATFNGVTDDTGAINAALAAAAAATGPCEVVFPPGEARVGTGNTSVLVIGRDGLRIRGAGPSVTRLRSVSNTAPVIQYRKPTNGQVPYQEWMTLQDFSVLGTGVANHATEGMNMHDPTLADDDFNGGSLRLVNLGIGANGNGFRTGLHIKRWDTFIVENCRILYNYTNAHFEAFTRTCEVRGGGNSQAESVLWSLGYGAKVNFISVDNGNSPQWIKMENGSTAAFIGCNFETDRFSPSSTMRYYNANSAVRNAYPQVTNLASVDGTGLFTTASSANLGFKPGVAAYIGTTNTSLPILASPLNTTEVYEVAESGFSATQFRLLPVPRLASVTVGSATLTVDTSGLRANYSDLVVGSKVRLITQGIDDKVIAYTGGTLGGGARLPNAEYWITSLTDSADPDALPDLMTVSDAPGGADIVFQTAGSLFMRPVDPIIPSVLPTNATVMCPPIALRYSAGLTITDCQFTANSGNPLAVMGTGCTFTSNGTWHTHGFTGTGNPTGAAGQAGTLAGRVSGRVYNVGLNSRIDGYDVPCAQANGGGDSGIARWSTGRKITVNTDAGMSAATVPVVGSNTTDIFMLAKDGTTGAGNDERWFKVFRDWRGLYGPESQLIRDIPKTLAITSAGTLTTHSELKPRCKYRVDYNAGANIVLKLPDNVTTGSYTTWGYCSDERVTYDDEIEIVVRNSGGYPVEIRNGNTNGTIRRGSAVSASGTANGITISEGDSVRLKCLHVTGSGDTADIHWFVMGSQGHVSLAGKIPTVPSYADDTAADVDLNSGDFYWNTTTGKLDQVP